MVRFIIFFLVCTTSNVCISAQSSIQQPPSLSQESPTLTAHQWCTLMDPITQNDLQSAPALRAKIAHSKSTFLENVYTLDDIFDEIFNALPSTLCIQHPNCAQGKNYNYHTTWPMAMDHLAPLYRLLKILTCIDYHCEIVRFDRQSSHNALEKQRYEELQKFLTDFPFSDTPAILRTLFHVYRFFGDSKFKMSAIFSHNAQISVIQSLIGLTHRHIIIPVLPVNNVSGEHQRATRVMRHISTFIASTCLIDQLGTAYAQSASWFFAPQSALQSSTTDFFKTLPDTLKYPKNTRQHLGAPAHLAPELLILLKTLGYFRSLYAPENQSILHTAGSICNWQECMDIFQKHGLSQHQVDSIFNRISTPQKMNPHFALVKCRKVWLPNTPQQYYSTTVEATTIFNRVIEYGCHVLPRQHPFKKQPLISFKPSREGDVEMRFVMVNGKVCAPFSCQNTFCNTKKVLVIVPSIDNIRQCSPDEACDLIISCHLTAQLIDEFLHPSQISSQPPFTSQLAQRFFSNFYPPNNSDTLMHTPKNFAYTP